MGEKDLSAMVRGTSVVFFGVRRNFRHLWMIRVVNELMEQINCRYQVCRCIVGEEFTGIDGGE